MRRPPVPRHGFRPNRKPELHTARPEPESDAHRVTLNAECEFPPEMKTLIDGAFRIAEAYEKSDGPSDRQMARFLRQLGAYTEAGHLLNMEIRDWLRQTYPQVAQALLAHLKGDDVPPRPR